jgi:hypothetical protein
MWFHNYIAYFLYIVLPIFCAAIGSRCHYEPKIDLEPILKTRRLSYEVAVGRVAKRRWLSRWSSSEAYRDLEAYRNQETIEIKGLGIDTYGTIHSLTGTIPPPSVPFNSTI